MQLKRRKIKSSLRNWQQARSWARLIKEAEILWQDEQKELKRLGALELSQLIEEIPPSYRRRVNLWLIKFSKYTSLLSIGSSFRLRLISGK